MTLRKRLRALYALWRQQWHQKTCGDCGGTWWVEGRPRPELIAICDDCEEELLDRMETRLRLDFHTRLRKGKMA